MLLSAVMLLSACSYFDTGGPALSGDQIDLTNHGQQVVSSDITTEEAFLVRSKGGVEIYSLDGPLAESAPRYIPSRVPTTQPVQRVVQQEPVAIAPEAVVVSALDEEPAPVMEEKTLPPSPSPSEGGAVVYFEHGSDDLNAQNEEILSIIAERFDPSRGIGLDVMGHASMDAEIRDPVQRKIVNLKESMNRAFSVAAILIEKGVPAEALRVTGWGDTRPPPRASGIGDGFNADAAARRVEIFQAAQ